MGNEVLAALAVLREKLTAAKPNDRSETDRRCQILLTDLEKLEACIATWGIGQ